MQAHGRSPEEFIRAMMHRYNIRFQNFRFSDDENNLITLPHHTMERSAFLKKVIRDDRPLIVDAFACIGADTMALMADFPLCSMFAVQRTRDKVELERFQRLVHNTALFNKAFCGNCCSLATVPTAIEKFLPAMCKQIDLLYLDPPWTAADGQQYTDRGVVKYLDSIVKLAQHRPRLLVVKLKHDLTRMLPMCFDGFMHVQSLKVMMYGGKRVSYYFHVFISTLEI